MTRRIARAALPPRTRAVAAAAASAELAPREVLAQAYGVGFDLAGIAPLGPVATAKAFRDWLDRGYGGNMRYLHRSAKKRLDTRIPEPKAVTAIVVAMRYGAGQPAGPIARYARGDDYHDVMSGRLAALAGWITDRAPADTAARWYVDTGPILERDLARTAGLGWVGKNACLIHPEHGSFFLLGTLLVGVALTASAPLDTDHCGSCTRCLDACPTNAFVEPRVLDATRCISYLTIEYRGVIPTALRPAIGTRIAGCDVCQDVCPWNVKFADAHGNDLLAARTELVDPDLHALLALTEHAFAEQFDRTPVARLQRRGLARNTAVALGNRRGPGDRDALVSALVNETDELVREHIAWGLAQFTDAHS